MMRALMAGRNAQSRAHPPSADPHPYILSRPYTMQEQGLRR